MLSASKMFITSICEADSLPAAKFLKPNKMKHRVFFSFEYNKDNWRAGQVRNMGKVDGYSTFSDNDWERVKLKTDKEIRKWKDVKC